MDGHGREGQYRYFGSPLYHKKTPESLLQRIKPLRQRHTLYFLTSFAGNSYIKPPKLVKNARYKYLIRVVVTLAIFRFHNLNELVAHFPARRVALRVGRFAIPLRAIDLTIFARNPPLDD